MSPRGMWDGSTYQRLGGSVGGTVPVSGSVFDWNETTNTTWTNNSSTYRTTGSAEARAQWAAATVVPIQTNSTDFWTNLNNTCNAASSGIVVGLPGGEYLFNSFRIIGGGGPDGQTYAFGFFHPRFRGFFGYDGPANTFVGMGPDKMTQAQLNALAAMDSNAFVPNQMGMIRIDGHAVPHLCAGVTFGSADQQDITSAPLIGDGVVLPQPAPHQGVILYGSDSQRSTGYWNNVRFQGAGKAWTSKPPFEHANVNTVRSFTEFENCESDGRRAARFDSARTRVCGPIMANNEYRHILRKWYQHDSNVSRYAVNDQNTPSTFGDYRVIDSKSERISNTNNDGKGGVTNATSFGYESTGASIYHENNLIVIDNPRTTGQIQQDVQFTHVGGPDLDGATFQVVGGEYRNPAFPTVDQYLCLRVTASYWTRVPYDTSMDIRRVAGGARLTPHIYTGSWAPTSAYLASNGMSPLTHYIVRQS